MSASKISQIFANNYHDNISLNLMLKKLTEIWNKKNSTTVNKAPRKALTQKRIREPNAYNIFVSEQMEVLRDLQKDMSKEEKPTGKDNMKRITQMWKEKKESA